MRRLRPAAAVLLAVLVWEALGRLLHVPAWALPTPSAVLVEMRMTWRLLLAASLGTAVPAALGAVVGGALGLVAGGARWSGVRRAAGFVGLLPLIAVTPILSLWLGFGVLPRALFVAGSVFIAIAGREGGTALGAGARAGAVAVAAAVAMEFAVPADGLGYRMIEANANQDMPASFAAFGMACALALAFAAAGFGAGRLLPRKWWVGS